MTRTLFERYIGLPLPMERELSLLFYANEPLTIFDVGACEAEDTIRYQQRFPNARLFAFEPVAENVARARRNLGEFGLTSVVLEQVALSDRAGSATLHLSSGRPPGVSDLSWDYGNKSSSLLAPDKTLEIHEWLTFERTVTVSTTTVEAYCRTHGIDGIDFLHLDVQGAELLVLAGAGALLPRIRAVWLEVESVPLYRDQPLDSDVHAFMREAGFTLLKDALDAVAGDRLYFRPSEFNVRRRALLGTRRVLEATRGRIRSSAQPTTPEAR